VLISLYYSNRPIRIFRRIFGGQKFCGEFSYRRRLGGLMSGQYPVGTSEVNELKAPT